MQYRPFKLLTEVNYIMIDLTALEILRRDVRHYPDFDIAHYTVKQSRNAPFCRGKTVQVRHPNKICRVTTVTEAAKERATLRIRYDRGE